MKENVRLLEEYLLLFSIFQFLVSYPCQSNRWCRKLVEDFRSLFEAFPRPVFVVDRTELRSSYHDRFVCRKEEKTNEKFHWKTNVHIDFVQFSFVFID